MNSTDWTISVSPARATALLHYLPFSNERALTVQQHPAELLLEFVSQ